MDPFADGKWVSWSSIGESVPVSCLILKKYNENKSILELKKIKSFILSIEPKTIPHRPTEMERLKERNNKHHFL